MDQDTLDVQRKEGESKSAFYLTYPGKMDLADDIAGYVDSCWFIAPTTRGPVKAIAYSWKGIMCINLIEMACKKSIIPELTGILEKFNVESTVTEFCERRYDYFPMEELTAISQTMQY